MVRKKYLKSNLPLVRTLHRLLEKKKVEEYKNIVNCLNDQSIDFLCECISNLCDKERFDNSSVKDRNKLLRITGAHSKEIKSICKERKNSVKKRKLIQEGSGFFLPLLSLIVPLITSLITGT